ncbi:hypothetical protein BN1080_00670 [Planococcus massiliensis]|uniref:Uncharacterized protein n=1 Tax=Planococcus massiliensis TaxID=1499687 RepID=A0A098EHH1_9BACL|nr:hypothetical protein BN1080_00670 [Planococcus massiliensis]
MTENFLKGLIFLINKWTKKEAAVESELTQKS